MSDLALPARRARVALADRLAVVRWGEVLAGVALALVFALSHAFVGIEHDARIYMGRALADVDPGGVGRDIMFRLDGQSSFSVFRVLAREAVVVLGMSRAVLVLTLVNLVAWFLAIAAFARILTPGRAIVLALACVCVLSTVYAPWNLIAAGESFPVPRPLAEAAVLLALAALCQGRQIAALALLLVAALFHPIMAAPGFGVLLVVLGLRDRRWLVAAGLAGAALVAAAALGLPLAARLMVRIDAAWTTVLVERNPYLYVGLWPHGVALSMLAVRVATIVLACAFVAGTARIVLLASLAVGIAGVAVSYGLGDLMANLLVVQAQLWRALWLSAALAPLAAGVCLWRLPRQGPAGQIALAFLVVGWTCLDWVPMAPLAAALALATYFYAPRLSIRLERLVLPVWLVAIGLVACAQWIGFDSLLALIGSLPPGVALPWGLAWQLQVAVLPVMGLAYAWWRWGDRPGAAMVAGAVAIVAAFLVVTQWDSRDAAKADVDSATHKPDLAAMLASRPDPVLWVEGDDAWYWLGRPNWSAHIQGSSIVFSRELALEWHRRAEAVVATGLSSRYLLRPLEVPPPAYAPRLDAARLAAFCRGFRAGEAPAWIVSPLDADTTVPQDLGIRIWSLPEPRWKLTATPNALHWRRLDRFAVIPCADAPVSPTADRRGP